MLTINGVLGLWMPALQIVNPFSQFMKRYIDDCISEVNRIKHNEKMNAVGNKKLK